MNVLRSLHVRLILGFALAGLLGTAAFALLLPTVTLGTFRAELQRERISRLERDALAHHALVGGWAGVEAALGSAGAGGTSPHRPVILDAAGRPVTPGDGPGTEGRERPDARPLTQDGRVVGYLVPGTLPLDTPEERALLTAVHGSLSVAALTRLVLVVLLGALLTRGMMRSLHHLTRAAQRFTLGGTYEPLEVRGHDEVAVLTATFNRMRAEIDRADGNRRRLVADVAHDLGTPLTVASGYVQAMVSGKLAPTPQRLAVLQGELDLMRGLVEDLRLVSRVDAGELHLDVTPVEASALLRAVHAAFAERAERQNVTLTVHAPVLPTLLVDELRVRQVLGNLVANALAHTPERGEVRLEGSVLGSAVEFVVRDTGEGIAEEHLPFVFERFYRAALDRGGGGSGLGLSIARSLTELQGGRLRLESTAGVGTTATVTFPQG